MRAAPPLAESPVFRAMRSLSFQQRSFRPHACALALYFVGFEGGAKAAEPPIGDDSNGLSGGRSVGAAFGHDHRFSGAMTLGYGLFDRVVDVRQGHRARVKLSAAYSPSIPLSVGMNLNSYFDALTSEEGGELNGANKPTVFARGRIVEGESFAFGLHGELELLGTSFPSASPAGFSPSLLALVSGRVGRGTLLMAQAGGRWERSTGILPEDSQLATTDWVSLGVSSWSSVLWGVGVTHRLAEGRSAWQVVSEVVGQTYVGTGAPELSVSPMQLGVGARRDVSSAISFGVHLFAAISARPAERALDEYVLIQPRVGGELSLQIRLGLPDEPLSVAKEEVEESSVEGDDADNPPEVEPAPQDVRGVVTDEAGEPLPDVLVQLRVDGSEMQEMRTYADGSFVFADVHAAPSQLTISASGFADSKFAWTSPEDMPDKFVLSTAVPAGQLKGTVRALSGEAVAAQVTVEPDGEPQLADEKGEFELELAPGRHQVHITADGYLTQKRWVVIRNRGVVILNISLMPDKSRSESSDQGGEL